MRPGARRLFLLVSLAAATPAWAAEIADDDGLRIDLGKTPRCVILPRKLQVPADCGGEDVGKQTERIEANARSAPPGTSLLAAVIWKPSGGSSTIMIIMSSPHLVPTSANLADMAAGMWNPSHPKRPPIEKRSDPRLAYDQITVAGTPAIRYSTDSEGGTLLAYAIFGAKRYYTVMFVTGGADDTETRAFAQKLMARLSLPRMAADEQRQFGVAADPAKSLPWRAGQRAQVRVRWSGEVTNGGRTQRWDMRSSYVLFLEAKGDDLVVERRERKPWAGELAPAVLAATYLADAPSRFVLTRDHAGIARIEDFAAARDAVFGLLSKRGATADAEARWKATATETVARENLDDHWVLLETGAWADKAPPGSTRSDRQPMALPQLQGTVDVIETVRNLGPTPCADGVACLRLERVTEPDPSQLQNLIGRLTRASPPTTVTAFTLRQRSVVTVEAKTGLPRIVESSLSRTAAYRTATTGPDVTQTLTAGERYELDWQ
jgi:hypothetical protein